MFVLPIDNCTKKLHCKVIIFQNACKIYLEQLPVKISFNICFFCFCWFIKALNAIFVYRCN